MISFDKELAEKKLLKILKDNATIRLSDVPVVGLEMNSNGIGRLIKDSNDWFFEGRKLTDVEKRKVFEKMNDP
jgi:hypothetical protein